MVAVAGGPWGGPAYIVSAPSESAASDPALRGHGAEAVRAFKGQRQEERLDPCLSVGQRAPAEEPNWAALAGLQPKVAR